MRDQFIYLPTSLCRIATLPDDFTSDSKKMKDLQQYKLNEPYQRYDRINNLIEIFQRTEVLKEF